MNTKKAGQWCGTINECQSVINAAFARHPLVGCARPARLHCINKTKGVANYRIDLLIADIIGLAGALGWRLVAHYPERVEAASHLERTICGRSQNKEFQHDDRIYRFGHRYWRALYHIFHLVR